MIRVNTKRTVFPRIPSEAEQIEVLPLELEMLFCHYIQQGLLYQIPPADFSSHVDRLAETLSRLLVKFYPLAGRLTTSPVDGGIYILCNDSGVDFIEAEAEDLSIADLTTADVAPAVEELFALSGALNLEGHHLPLLAVQVTRLKDGIAVCCTVSHSVADGSSFWHLFNSWAHLCRTDGNKIPANPVYDRSLLNLGGPPVKLGFDPDGHIPRFCPPPLRIKIFHFSAKAISRLKEQVNRGSPVTISSFQALCGHLWRAITRARGLGPDEQTNIWVSVNLRSRLRPQLPSSYFGSVIQNIFATATARELSSFPLSFPAGLLNGIISGHMDEAIRKMIDEWRKQPIVITLDQIQKNCIVIGNSPRFEMYENDFGWGRPVAVRSGMANHFDGKVSVHPSREGGGSVELEVCLPPATMNKLEDDPDFTSA
ncbi:hypothetical protein SUGI_0873360 [Cryptomeria japonica]|uniref:BAHD acyltransferase DCR n=1 Tax=Cryptomeria japonica TaxID=3369 RepID=UPI002414AFA8|nr:BAHD acyltransferase DCR [Cryptomeria japonica]GLJ42176.1 hypothetical protein SUGI_0873360 [Cryptomeria japonica]